MQGSHFKFCAGRAISLLGLFALCLCLFFFRLGDRDLWSSHEGRAAQNAQSILADGHWGLPRLFDGRIELQKPPLYYWIVAGIAWLRGVPVDAWAVRLPAALAALGGVLCVLLLGLLRHRPVAGLIAAAVLATMLHYTWLARTGRIDMVLAFSVSMALGCFWLSKNSAAGFRRIGWLVAAYLSLGGSLLLKGPIGLVLIGATITIFLLCEGEVSWRGGWNSLGNAIHRCGLWWGLPLAFGVALPWYIWAGIQTNGELYRVFFWYHNVARGVGSSDTLGTYPWWFYGPRLVIDLLPWSLLLPAAGWLCYRRGWWSLDAEARFGLAWLLVMAAVLSCAQFKRADYLLPAYAGAALFLGCIGERWYQERNAPNRWAVSFGVAVLACSLGWWVYLDRFLAPQEPQRDRRPFAALIRQHFPRPAPVIFFRVEDHALAFHVGQPIDTILEWENIDVWAGRPGTFYIVMDPQCARDWPRHVTSGKLEEVARNTGLAGGSHENPLVLLRTCPPSTLSPTH